MARILVTFFNGMYDENDSSVMPIFYEGFIRGLENAGNCVAAVSHPWFGAEFGPINDELKKSIIDFAPDICFSFNNCFYDLSDVVECPIIIYEVDSPVYFSNKEIIRSKPDRFLYFLMQSSSVDVMIKQFGVNPKRIFCLPGFSEVYFDRNIQPSTNVVFIGSRFTRGSVNLFHRFMEGNPSENELDIWKKCINEIRLNPQISAKELIYKYLITSELVASHLVVPEILQVLSGEKRIQVLSAMAELGLELYGTSNWGNEYYGNTNLNFAYNNRRVYSIQHNQEILNASKIGINVSHIQAKSGFPWRVMDIMASNACLVTDYHSDFEKEFPELVDIIPIYDNSFDAYLMCKKLLQDEQWRKDIVLNCNNVINERFRFANLLKKMEEYSNVVMHEE